MRSTLAPRDPHQLGQLLADSGYFSDAQGAAQAAVKVMAGAELGFPPIQSMMGVYIVKGKVTLSANLMAAAIKRHPRYTFRVREHTAQRCAVEFIEDGEAIGTSEFSMDDAKAAGLAGSDTWRKFPKNMLYARALSNGAKWYCPDVFGGPIYTPDELGAVVDGETGELVGGDDSLPALPMPSDIPNDFHERPVQRGVGTSSEGEAGTAAVDPSDDPPLDHLRIEIAAAVRRLGVKAQDFRGILEAVGAPVPDTLKSKVDYRRALADLTDGQAAALADVLVKRESGEWEGEAAVDMLSEKAA